MRIRQLNDEFRTHLLDGMNFKAIAGNAFKSDLGTVFLSPHVNTLEDYEKIKVIEAVGEFCDFDDDDESDEHDFWSVYVGNQIYHCSIIYIDASSRGHPEASPDPSDPEITVRMLMIRHWSEQQFHM